MEQGTGSVRNGARYRECQEWSKVQGVSGMEQGLGSVRNGEKVYWKPQPQWAVMLEKAKEEEEEKKSYFVHNQLHMELCGVEPKASEIRKWLVITPKQQ
jgi:hypothetical protein